MIWAGDVGWVVEAAAVSTGALHCGCLLHVGPSPPRQTLAAVGRGEGVIMEFKENINAIVFEGLGRVIEVEISAIFKKKKCILKEMKTCIFKASEHAKNQRSTSSLYNSWMGEHLQCPSWMGSTSMHIQLC